MNVVMKDIHKSFGSNQVLQGVDFEIRDGEIHALMGENGAGKSTLMNILTGLHPKNSGTIYIDGKETSYANPKEAEKAGITFIHQELNIWHDMSVLENLFIGKEIKKKTGLVDNREMKRLAALQFEKLGITIPLEKPAGKCSVGEQQMIEIAKALMTDCKILIMDEPTAALTERETEKLFSVIDSLQASGVAIVYISHRMEEIFRICDRITVMRDGKSVDTKNIPDTSFEEVVKKMVGRELTDRFPKRSPKIGEVVFEAQNLHGNGFKDVNFSLRRGEIVGVAGLMGAGRTEIMRTIFGLDAKHKGKTFVNGKEVNIKNPKQAVAHGIGFVTEDRKTEGLILDFSVRENISIPSLKSLTGKGLLKRKQEDDFSEELIKKLTVKTASREIPVKSLSGGNQQKVVIAKWIGVGSKILILDEPTRGVDVGAKREIYQLMNELTAQGVSILMVSSELPEILGMSDRILVVHEGKINGELMQVEATQEKIMTYATGGR
ncbi:MAG: sugar ABC transporter ATP-binding protein [Turicibacter sp.]|nr:sugar ABC transporter ATP-binding protein [Turicibacter sp.]